MTRSPSIVGKRNSRSGPRLKVVAISAAAVTATSVTTVLVSVVLSLESLVWIVQMRGAPPELKSLYGFKLGEALAAWPLDALRDVIFAPLLGTAFGFVGAFLFLGVGFFVLDRRGAPARQYLIGGAAIGLLHSFVGFSLRGTDLLPWDYRMAAEPLVGWVGLIGGFSLTGARPIATVATFFAAPVAGAVAGVVYVRLLRGSRRTDRVISG